MKTTKSNFKSNSTKSAKTSTPKSNAANAAQPAPKARATASANASANATVKKRGSHLTPEIQAKGAAALAQWRKERDTAKKKGGKAYENWLAEQELKKALKKTTPMQAIKAFCMSCVGDIREDVRNCTSTKCPLYIYRPFQKGDDE